MRAQEQTFRNIARLHIVFALSAFLLLVLSLLVVIVEHHRPWKAYQNQYREQVDAWFTQAQIERLHAVAGSSRSQEFQRQYDQLLRHNQGLHQGWLRHLLKAPFIDALSRLNRVEEIRLSQLPLDYHFQPVQRIDRCITCHVGIMRRPPPFLEHDAFAKEKVLVKVIEPFSATDRTGWEDRPQDRPQTTERVSTAKADILTSLGLALAQDNFLGTPAIAYVIPESPAYRSGLQMGDRLLAINGQVVTSPAEAKQRLERLLENRQRIVLQVRRGLPQPLASHPRLDLYVGEDSFHPLPKFGCTICHDGRGPSTTFVGAMHSPQSIKEQKQWEDRYKWRQTTGWDWPMRPLKLTQSNCLQCHHQVLDLLPKDPAETPSAPLLVEGYLLFRRYGCFGCHEVSGQNSRGLTIGPNLLLEPRYGEIAAALLDEFSLDSQSEQLARQLVLEPTNTAARQALVAQLRHLIDDRKDTLSPHQQKRLLQLTEALTRTDNRSGAERKIGPSLRHIREKLSEQSIIAFLRNPGAILPGVRMPQSFGLLDHLDAKSRQLAERYDAVEIAGIAAYLIDSSRPIQMQLQAPLNENYLPASAKRGEWWFATKGCAACHKHAQLGNLGSNFGPDLTTLSKRLDAERGRHWLRLWLSDPQSYWPRCRMPKVSLAPIPAASLPAELQSTIPPSATASNNQLVDPVRDIVAFLLPDTPDQKFTDRKITAVDEKTVDELAKLYLRRQLSQDEVDLVLSQGLSKQEACSFGWPELSAPVTLRKKLVHIGRNAIARRGCYGCHEIPGFELSEPVGPELTKWGSKPLAELGFELVAQYLATRSSVENKSSAEKSVPIFATDDQTSEVPHWLYSTVTNEDKSFGPETSRKFFQQAASEGRREGFAWQKLSEPRSFDYGKAQDKSYLEWLVMGRFELTERERQALTVFLLALQDTVISPSLKAHYHNTELDWIRGRKILDDYGCLECHAIRLPQWQVLYDPQQLEPPPVLPDFDFLNPKLDEAILDKCFAANRQGFLSARLRGLPELDIEGQLLQDVDENDNPIYFFNLWQDVPVKVGEKWMPIAAGSSQLIIADPLMILSERKNGSNEFAENTISTLQAGTTFLLEKIYPGLGGRYAYWLLPRLTRPGSISATDSLCFVPPVLTEEGRKVRPEWLRAFLENPYPIRPAAVLPMPKFNLSEHEIDALVQFFEADIKLQGKYEIPGLRTPNHAMQPPPGIAIQRDAARLQRLDAAFKVLGDQTTFCAKCHLLGNYSPGGQVNTTLAPRLDLVHRRLTAAYIRRWLANPKRVLPYTGMPVNFPPTGPPIGQDLLPGASIEQLDTMLDLLVNFDHYLSVKANFGQLIRGKSIQTEDNYQNRR